MSFARAIAESEFRDASSRSARNGTQPSAGHGKGARLAESTRQARKTQHAMLPLLRAMARAEAPKAKVRDSRDKRQARAHRAMIKRAEYAIAYLSLTPNAWAETEARAIARAFVRAAYRKRAALCARAIVDANAIGGLECARALVAHVTILAHRGHVTRNDEPDRGFTIAIVRAFESAFDAVTGAAYATARKIACGTSRALSNAHDAVSFDGAAWSRADLNQRAQIVGQSADVVPQARAALRAAYLRRKFAKKTDRATTQGKPIAIARKRIAPNPIEWARDDSGRIVLDNRSDWHRRARLYR